MIITNRRDAGYTIVSRFEESFRQFVIEKIGNISINFFDLIPNGVIKKANERGNTTEWPDLNDFFNNIDLIDLKEIVLYKNNFNDFTDNKIDKSDFILYFDEIYQLRCKIAHIKGFFTSIDLDKLIELTKIFSDITHDQDFILLLKEIYSNPSSVIIKIPIDFIHDFISDSGIIHNLPTPDYEYEGGFVGRDEDRKKIIGLLKSEKFPVVTITGAGGVGKTSLALKVIQDLTERSDNKIFDSIVWLSAKENRLSPLGIEDIEPTLKSYEELLDTLIQLFGFSSELICSSIESKEELTKNIISLNDRMLVVIDNLETITDERIINFIIEAPGNVKFLVTSRKGIGEVERRHVLKELKLKEAIYLFRQLSKDKQLDYLVKLGDELIGKYVSKVSYYPLAIKWVIGQVARGKDINKVIESIHNDESDISKFCFEQIYNSLPESCKRILFTLSLMSDTPTSSILQHITEIDDVSFEDSIEQLILVSFVIPEQFQGENKEIVTKFNLLPLTKGFTRLQLHKLHELREYLNSRIIDIESIVSESDRAKKEYKHSLFNFGAKTDEEKVATIIAQTAFQKYQSGFYDQAVEDYKRAIKTAPKFASLYRNWGVMESYEDHLQEANRLMEKAAELNSKDPQIFLLWGNIFRKGGKFLDAHEKYQLAYDLAKDDPIVLNAFGQAKSRLGFFEEADKLLKASLNYDGFQSIKHEIINRTSISENFINWGDMLVRDKNLELALEKYNEAINCCLFALNSNARDSKIYTTLTKALLKKGHLYLQNKDYGEFVACHESIINSTDKTFKHSLFKITALVDLIEYYLKLSNYFSAEYYYSILNRDYKQSLILKQPKFFKLQERVSKIKTVFEGKDASNGIIERISRFGGYVIIRDVKSNLTYIGGCDDFIPAITLLDDNLIGLKVFFLKSIIKKNDAQKLTAKFIIISR